MRADSIKLVRSTILLLLLSMLFAAKTNSETLAKAIPEPAIKSESAQTYHGILFDADDPRYKESMVPLKKYGIAGEAFYARKDRLNAPYYRCVCPESEEQSLQLRKTVAEKLKRINSKLAAQGIELYVYDAYRPVSCQTKLWNYFIEEAKQKLGKDASERDVIKYAGTYCADPRKFDAKDFKTWPTHSTGGAVDLTLKRKGGELLFMGSIFDDDSEITNTNHFELLNKEKTLCPSYKEAMNNRRILYWAMNDEGFTNYHNEWWHYEYGTQMWIQDSGQKDKKAFYGTVYNGHIQ